MIKSIVTNVSDPKVSTLKNDALFPVKLRLKSDELIKHISRLHQLENLDYFNPSISPQHLSNSLTLNHPNLDPTSLVYALRFSPINANH
jgi:hypothetical protein